MLSDHVAYLRVIRLVDAEFNGVSGNRRFFNLAVLSLAGVREMFVDGFNVFNIDVCLLYTSPSPRDQRGSRMPSSA